MAEKIGVYIDQSGVGPLLNAEELAEFVKNKFGGATPVVKTHPRLASDDGRALIKADVDAGGLDGVLVCGSSPRVDWDIFDFPGVLVERVNLREQCAMCYQNPDGSLPAAGGPLPKDLKGMAEDYLKMGVVKLQKMKAPTPDIPETTKRILVLGGGWTGLTSALNAAAAGYDVLLVEQAAALGGWAAKMYKSIPKSYPYTTAEDTGIQQKIKAVTANPKISVATSTALVQLTGAPGNYEAKLAGPKGEETTKVGAVVLATGWVEQDKKYLEPLGYGKFKNVVTSMEFETMVAKGGLSRPGGGTAKSVAFLVDVNLCTAAAAEAPAAPAVPAAEAKKPEEKKEGEAAETTFVYPDMESCKHMSYSSELSSLVALKQAGYVVEKDASAVAYIFYEHMMVPGINERYYKAAQDKPGVMLTKGLITDIREDADKGLIISAKDTLLGELIEVKADLVVVPTAMVPVTAHEPTINLNYRQGPAFPDLPLFDGFVDSNYICFPYETRRTGIYAAGCVRQPMTMGTAETDAAGATLKAIQCLASLNRGMAVHPRSGDMSFPVFNFVRCTQCKRCTEECPFGALDDDPKGTPMPNPTRCRRCGTCMGACPERVISFDNYNIDQIGTMIKQIEVPPDMKADGPRALVLVCENDAYPALDMAAMRGHTWSPYVRFIPVRCLGSVNTIWIADAMSRGMDGVLLLGCRYGDDYQCHFVKGSELCNRRMANVAESLNRLGVEPERVLQEQVAIDEYDQVPAIIDRFMDAIIKIGPNPFKGY
jgi:quinone-modifying oxidoreductase subunit QmoB